MYMSIESGKSEQARKGKKAKDDRREGEKRITKGIRRFARFGVGQLARGGSIFFSRRTA